MRVMVVIHDRGRRQSVSEFLRQRGYEVHVPPTRHEVLSLVREREPEVLVLDMYVSNPSGLEVLRQVRGGGYAGRIVALAGKSQRSVQRDALSWGVSQVVGGRQSAEDYVDPAQVETAIRSCSVTGRGTAQVRKGAG